MLEYFGPRKKKKAQIPHFSYFEEEGKGIWAFIFFDLNKKAFIKYKGVPTIDLWSNMVSFETPSLWLSYNLSSFVSQLIRDVVSPEWIESRVVGPKGKDTEKFSLISREGNDVLSLTIRQEKKKVRISSRPSDLTLSNINPFYKWGVKSLGEDFGSPFKDQLESRFFGVNKIMEFIVEKLQVSPQASLAGAALNCLQTLFIDSKVPKISKSFEEFIKASFFGGITEVYKIHEPHCWGYDKNGLYSEAYTNLIPIKGSYVKDTLSVEEFMEIKDLGFVDVDIYVPEDINKPPLPIRGPNGIVRPVGEIKSTKEYPVRFFSEELKVAVRKKKAIIRNINFGVFFKTSGYLLQEWATYTNSLKDSATSKGERALAKEAQNSVYGKFAQKQLRQITHLGKVSKERRGETSITIIDEDTPIWFEDIEVKLANSLPHIASAITAWARVLASNDSDRLEAEGISLSYHDTDSFHTDRALPIDMVGTLSGKYKCEFEDCEAFHITQKVYIINKGTSLVKKKVKGIPTNLITPEMLKSFIEEKEPIEVSWESEPSLQSVMVDKFLYKPHEENFKTTLSNRVKHNTRSIPSNNLLQLDKKRKQVDYTNSVPLNFKEVFKWKKD